MPGAYIENLLRKLTVQDTAHLKTHHFNTKCLAISKVKTVLDLLLEQGLLVDVDEKGDEVDAQFDDYDALVRKADYILGQMPDDPSIHVNLTSIRIGLNGLRGMTRPSTRRLPS